MIFDDITTYAPNQETMLVFAKGFNYIRRCSGNIGCAVSGGADSDIMVDILTKLDDEKKIRYVFFDTGIEYQATKRHLDELEQKYNIKIDRVRAKKTVPVSCRQYGVPFFSKYVSEMMYRLQRHGFQWEDESYDVLVKRYPKCKVGLKWWCNENGKTSGFNISKNKLLKEFIIQNPPKFKISAKCCHYAKKRPSADWCKENDIELLCLGVRKAENGIRSKNIKTCFSNSLDNGKGHDEWLPLFWLSDDEKQEYKKFNNIKYSDCYEVYGLKRTGCFGCPFASGFENELKVIKQYEPNLYVATNNIFGQSYEYMRAYREFKRGLKESFRKDEGK